MFERLLRFWRLWRSRQPHSASFDVRDDAYEQAFGTIRHVHHSVDRATPHVDLYECPPTPERDFIAIVTGGMSDQPMPVEASNVPGPRRELMMGIGAADPKAILALKLTANYPFQCHTEIDIHHTVSFGSEFGDGSALSAFLFVAPRFLPDSLAELELYGQRVQFLQAVLITTAEQQYAMREGSEKLEPLLDAHGYLITRDFRRPSVVDMPAGPPLVPQ
jgi:hypothetical protein